MTSLGDLIPSLLPFRHKGPPPPPPSTATPEDHCPCFKPDGCWGNCGIHFRFFGEMEIHREIMRSLENLPSEVDREKVERNVRDWCELYKGRHVAYERCPLYYAKVKAEIEARKAQQQKDRKSRKQEIAEDDE